MQDKEIIAKWQQGLSKEQLAKIYKREYNMQIKIIRSTVRHKHSRKYITNREALNKVETVILKYIKEEKNYE